MASWNLETPALLFRVVIEAHGIPTRSRWPGRPSPIVCMALFMLPSSRNRSSRISESPVWGRSILRALFERSAIPRSSVQSEMFLSTEHKVGAAATPDAEGLLLDPRDFILPSAQRTLALDFAAFDCRTRWSSEARITYAQLGYDRRTHGRASGLSGKWECGCLRLQNGQKQWQNELEQV